VFTGIVTHRGRIGHVEVRGGVTEFGMRPETPMEGIALGDSVALDGVCLTVAAIGEDGTLRFDAVPETLRKTTLGDRAVGDRVNLEAPLRLGDPFGGHWVQGHVDGTGRVDAVEHTGDDVRMVIAVEEDLFRGVLPKGSITLDGVSLTVGEADGAGDGAGGTFSVYLIPHTLAVTGMGGKTQGDRVNVELDVLGRWVEHHLRLGGRDVTGR
jgi:riboflavin synthase alpha subunit